MDVEEVMEELNNKQEKESKTSA